MRQCSLYAIGLMAFCLIACAVSAIGQIITIPLKTEVFDGKQVKPGSKLVLQPGHRKVLKITGLRGTEKKPITVINGNGLVRVANNDRGFAIAIQNCQHVRFTGTGSKKLTYGIQAEATRKGMFAVHINAKSSHIEVDHIEVTGAGFGGFNVKDEPKFDGSTNRDKFVMTDIYLHHNYVRDVEGEGFYVGHSFFSGWTHKPSGKVLYPHLIKNLRIENNKTENTGCEGIQIGCATDNVRVVDNLIIKPGQRPFAKWQDNGMQINCAGTVLVARNRVVGAPANGLIMAVLEDKAQIVVGENVFANCGGYAMYLGGKQGKQASVAAVNNTVISTKKGSFRFANPVVTEAHIANNLIVDVPKGPERGKRQAGLEAGNVMVKSLKELKLNMDETGMLTFARRSPLAGKGVALPKAIRIALADSEKLSRKRPDVGAKMSQASK